MIDLSFPAWSTHPIPADHGYHLYAAISRLLPALHESNGIAIHPLPGRQCGDRLMMLLPWSAITLRVQPDRIPDLLPLAGKRIDLGGCILRIGVPQVAPLRPATALRSRLVTIKGFMELDPFREAARRQLDALGVSTQATLAIPTRDGRPIRRTLRIRDKEVVGYEVVLEALSADESLRIQESGLGGRRHMGCGVFVPLAARAN